MFQKMSLTFKFGNSNISHIKHEYMKAFFVIGIHCKKSFYFYTGLFYYLLYFLKSVFKLIPK